MKPTTLPRSYVVVIFAVMAARFFVAPARGEPLTDEQAKALIQRVDELEREVKELKGNQVTNQPVAPTQSTNAPTVSLGLNGLIVRSADSNLVVVARGYVQADGRDYFGQKSTPDTFLLRRVRPILEGSFWRNFDFRLMLDFGSGNVSSSTANNVNVLDDAYVNARFWKQAQFQIGKYKSPLGLERAQSSADLFFIETGFATELTPNYDLGAEIHNDCYNTPVGYALGIFTGAADGASQDTDADEGKDIVGRLFLRPFMDTDYLAVKGLGFGVGGSIGSHTAGTLANYKTPGQQTFYTYSTNVSAGGVQYRLDPQAYYFLGPFGIQGEYILSSQKLKTTGAGGMPPVERFNNQAWQIEASYFLTDEENSFKTTSYQHVVPRHRFRLGEDGWGAVEIVGRLEQLSLDSNSFVNYGAATFTTAGSAQRATSWGTGVNWYLNANLKLNLNYEFTTFHGITAAPAGVTAASAKPEHALLSQVQFSF